MADFRNIFTRIWHDKWFTSLEPDEKLLFIYLWSNERTSVCGMYELPLRTIIFETDLSKDRVIKILEKFQQAKKIFYIDDVLWVVNFQKYNNSGNSVKVQTRINKDYEMTRDGEVKRLYAEANKIPYPSLKIPYPKKFYDTETDTDTEKETERETETNFSRVFSSYQKNIGLLTEAISESLKDDIDHYSDEWVIEAINEATRKEKRSLSYVEGILKTWKREGKNSGNKNNNGKKKTITQDGISVEVELA